MSGSRWIGEIEQGDGGFGQERFEEVGAGVFAVHVFDHHARGFEGPCFFDGEREGESAREVVVVGWVG